MTKSQKFDFVRIFSSRFVHYGKCHGYHLVFIAAYVIGGYRTIIEAVMGIVRGQLLDEKNLKIHCRLDGCQSGICEQTGRR